MITKLEQLQSNQWPSLQTMFHDGWVLRFADGYSKRANSIVPMFDTGMENELKASVEECETIYQRLGLRPTFKMSPIARPIELDAMLESRGYSLVDRYIVQTVRLSDLQIKPLLRRVDVLPAVTEQWLEHYCRLSGTSADHKPTMHRMFQNLRAQAGFFLLYDDNRVVACGIGAVDQGYVGLWDIVTDPNYRQQGFGEQLVTTLLDWGRSNGASYGYLVVVSSNNAARKLYAKLGFEAVYEGWYRVKAQHKVDVQVI